MNARTELHEMIRRRINMLPDSPEKEAFEKDVSILFSLDNNQSLQGITAGAWLDKLQELSAPAFSKYVNKYQPGTLDVFREVNPRKAK